MAERHVVTALAAKRAEIAGLVVDEVLRLFDPDTKPEAIRAKRPRAASTGPAADRAGPRQESFEECRERWRRGSRDDLGPQDRQTAGPPPQARRVRQQRGRWTDARVGGRRRGLRRWEMRGTAGFFGV